MSVRAVGSLSEFNSVVNQSKLTVVDFFAKWCGPCKMIAPQIHTLAASKPNVNFVKVDVDEAGDIAAEYRIRAMPTFMFFKGGKKVDFFEGADFSRVTTLVNQYEDKQQQQAAEPVSIPSDDALNAMSPKELLQLMKAAHMNADGLLEKSELIAEIKKHRR